MIRLAGGGLIGFLLIALWPEDRPDFSPGDAGARPDASRLQAWEADLERRERELRKDKPEDPPKPPMSW